MNLKTEKVIGKSKIREYIKSTYRDLYLTVFDNVSKKK